MNQRLLSRRDFLKVAGASVLAAAVGGGLWRAGDQGVFQVGQGPAYAPWDEWLARERAEKDPLTLVRAAILAANPDNSQPWLFRLGANEIDVYADVRRNLPAVDPFQRNLMIGIGCALENMLLVGRALGYDPVIHYLPDAADITHAARLTLPGGAVRVSDLCAAIPARHMNRGAYDTNRPLAAETRQAMQASGEDLADVRLVWISEPGPRADLGKALVEATRATINDAGQAADIAAWTRSSWQEIEQHCDGITLDAAGLSPALLALAKMLPPMSAAQSNASWMQVTENTHTQTAAAYGVLCVRDRQDRRQQMQCGQMLERVHLWATLHGLGLHVMHQLADRAGREESQGLEPIAGRAFAALSPDALWRPLSMFRVGYPTAPARRSPRRPLAAVILP